MNKPSNSVESMRTVRWHSKDREGVNAEPSVRAVEVVPPCRSHKALTDATNHVHHWVCLEPDSQHVAGYFLPYPHTLSPLPSFLSNPESNLAKKQALRRGIRDDLCGRIRLLALRPYGEQ